MHQNTLLIGGAGVGGAGGAAFVWTRTGTAWSLQQQLVLPSALAYYGTELDLQLRRRGIRTIVLAGISTNMRVMSSCDR